MCMCPRRHCEASTSYRMKQSIDSHYRRAGWPSARRYVAIVIGANSENTCKGAVSNYSDLWFSYNTPGTMNLLPGVDTDEYLADIKFDLEESKKDLRKMCSNSALRSDLDILEKSGLGSDYVISIKNYFAEVSREADEK